MFFLFTCWYDLFKYLLSKHALGLVALATMRRWLGVLRFFLCLLPLEGRLRFIRILMRGSDPQHYRSLGGHCRGNSDRLLSN
jgi:hypothetical protein